MSDAKKCERRTPAKFYVKPSNVSDDFATAKGAKTRRSGGVFTAVDETGQNVRRRAALSHRVAAVA
ncbi:MAG: hypothetical protein WD875_06175 [Pirellulales bacterium]